MSLKKDQIKNRDLAKKFKTKDIKRLYHHSFSEFHIFICKTNIMENPFEELELRLIRIEDKLDNLIHKIENPTEDAPPVWMTTKQLAKHLGMSTSAITNFKGQKFPFYKVGGKILFKKQEIDDWLATTRHMSDSEEFDHFLRK